VGRAGGEVLSPRIGPGQADAVIAADLIGAQGRTARPMLGAARSRVVVSAEPSPTGAFVLNPETRDDPAAMLDSLRAAAREVVALPGARAVEQGFGDLIFLNLWLLGAAWQRGLVPMGREAIREAITLNGVAVERNLAAFEAGRRAAPAAPRAPETLEQLIARRVADLTAYQSARYAARYADFVAKVQSTAPQAERLHRAVATQLYRLMAIKDEYEVARLHSDPAWQAELARRFTGTTRVALHLAPPLLSRPGPDGRPRKREFGPWMLRAMGLLRHGKALRGTWLDPFAHTEERRTERALPAAFMAGVERHLHDPERAADWAEAAAGIKGFGHVKAANLAKVRARWAELDSAAATG
jgi:indolepyruvate ferredoxin oxidoreductase